MILFIALVVLALLAVVSEATSSRFLLGRRPTSGFVPNGTTQQDGTTPQGGTYQQGGGNFAGRTNFRSRNSGILNLFRIAPVFGRSFIWIMLGWSILGILLLALSAYGVWKTLHWSLNLSLVLGLVYLVGALPALFSIGGRGFNLLRFGMDLLSLVAAAVVAGLCLLPSVRDYFPAPLKKAR